MKKRSLVYISLMTLSILAIPAITMQFTDQVDWSLADFVVAFILLFFFGMVLTYIITSRFLLRRKLVLIALAIAILFVIWLELAVGIFGSPLAGR